MVVGAVSSRTELAVIGAGPGGYVAALRAADAGLDVTLIDRAELGGTCLNVGCIPSKSLIEIANLRSRLAAAVGHGLAVGPDSAPVDVPALASHLGSISRKLRTGVGSLLADAGVAVIQGDASFARYDRLSIVSADQVSHLEFDNAVIATGSRPVELPGFAFGDGVLSSTGALQLTSMPDSMAIIGGGYIGIELGTAWAKLGVPIAIIEAASSILPDVPAQLRQPVERQLRALGVAVHTSARAHERTSSGVRLDDGTDIESQIVVVAVGRQPNSDQASLDILGLDITDSGHVVVDEHLRAAPGIYAIGDLVDGPALAHKASADAEAAVDAILRRPVVRSAAIPAVMFSDPEIMMVGVELDQAKREGLTVSRFPHSALARAHTLGSAQGSTFIVSDRQGTVVGVHAVGPHASELAGEATLAIEMATTIEDLSMTIHAHPTMSESVAEAAYLARGMPLHVRR